MDVQSLLASGNFQRAEASHLPFIDSFFEAINLDLEYHGFSIAMFYYWRVLSLLF
jgi:hypothetical protein